MTFQFGEDAYYKIYCEKRLSLPLYQCYRVVAFPLIGFFDKGFYRCEEIGDAYMIVYDTPRGTLITKTHFDMFFRKPSKLRLLLYKLWG